MNDFAAPIIQAFMQGQQMKRQTQQDVIAAQEREKEAKRYETELKRIEQRDKLANAFNMMQLREHVAKGIGDGSIVTRDPGLQAQQMGPIGQQLMQMQPQADPAQLPLQETSAQVSQEPMQLGPQFNIGSTGQFRDPIIDIGGIKFDAREFRGPEETQKDLMQRLMMGADAKAYGAARVKAAEQPYAQAIEGTRNKGKLAVAQLQADASKANNTATNDARIAIAEEAAAARKAETAAAAIARQQTYELAKQRLNNSLARLNQDKTAVGDDIEATINEFRTGVLGKDDISKVPLKVRNTLYKKLQDSGVTMLSNKQKEGVKDFSMLKMFADMGKELSTAYSENPILGNDTIGPVANVRGRMEALLDPVGRSLDYKGVLTNDDAKRLRNLTPSKFTSKAEDMKRDAAIRRISTERFNQTYPAGSVGLAQRRNLAKMAGIEEWIFPEVK